MNIDLQGLTDESRLLEELIECGGYSREEAEHRWKQETAALGWNVLQDVSRFGVTPHVYDAAMERLYREGDGFIFETLQYWRTPDRQSWSLRGLARLQAFCRERGVSPESLRVLMLGDGTGSDTLLLLQHGFQPRYFDVPGSRTSEFSRGRFARRGATAKIRIVETYESLLDESHDALWCFDVIEHLPDLPAAIKGMSDMLKQGAIALITESCKYVRADLPTHLAVNASYDGHVQELFRRAGLCPVWYAPGTDFRPVEYRKVHGNESLPLPRATVPVMRSGAGSTASVPVTLSFSVVVTSYNYRAYIAEAIDSALGQTLAPSQVIVVDDGSTDGSAEHVRSRYAADARVRVLEQENAGQLAAFSAGVSVAKGDIVAFLDADDLWEPRYLEKVAEIYTRMPSVDFVYTNMRYFGEREGFFHPEGPSRDDGISVRQGCYRLFWRCSPTSAITMRRPMAVRLTRVPPEFCAEWRTRADDCLAFGGDIFAAHKYYLADSLVRYRAHGANLWLGQPEKKTDATRRWLKLEGLMSFYRARAGIDPILRGEHLRGLKNEFRQKPQPTQDEYRTYVHLIEVASLSWKERLQHRYKMWRHWRRARLKAQRSSDPTPS